jgi:hypothetical protein
MNADVWAVLGAGLVLLAIAPIVPLLDFIPWPRRTRGATSVVESALENEAATRINNSPNHPVHGLPHPTFTATNGWTVEIIEPIGAAPFMRATKDDDSHAFAIPPLGRELQRALALGSAKRMGTLTMCDGAADAFGEFLIHLAARLRVRS